jgi:hypothetical protein
MRSRSPISGGDLVAWTPASAAMLTRIIDALPDDPADHQVLGRGAPGRQVKRWYVEGVERRDSHGQVWSVVPKGIEIRTTPQATIAATIREVDESFALLRAVAAMEGLHPIWISVHPTATAFVYDLPLNAYERAWHAADSDAATAALTQHGPIQRGSDHTTPRKRHDPWCVRM